METTPESQSAAASSEASAVLQERHTRHVVLNARQPCYSFLPLEEAQAMRPKDLGIGHPIKFLKRMGPPAGLLLQGSLRCCGASREVQWRSAVPGVPSAGQALVTTLTRIALIPF